MSLIKTSTESDEVASPKKNIVRDSFIWPIEKFSLNQFAVDKKRESPLFQSKRNNTMKWQLRIHKKEAKNEEYVSLSLLLDNVNHIEVTALCSFYVLGSDGGEKHKKVMKIQKFNETNTICTNHQFLKSNLLHNDDNNELLPNGNLILGCEIFYYCGWINTVGLQTNNDIKKSMNLLSNDMADMLQSTMFSDCAINVRDSQIKVHKCVIASRSKVFKSLLTEGGCKFAPNVIEMNSFRLEVVEEMVNYLYTGKSPNMDEMALELFEIGHKYELEQLKSMAEESLLYNLSIRNVCDYLTHSRLYSSKVLEEFCLRFIHLNC
uniref:Speckle-type POZ protein (inferred by orthology to a human protein) n=1 Tax=Strongyloides venezuelensis TaxID=75913 RepID=A0A0K0F516_STRVS